MTRTTSRLAFLLARVLCAIPLLLVASPAQAVILETWESQPATNPFTGTGDVAWVGDLGAWSITSTSTWPTSPAQDFAGRRSLRSSNHGSVGAPTPNTVAETVVTDISGELDLSRQMEWRVFFSGNLASIQPSRRADFILLSDSADASVIEDPNDMLNGFKLTLWDPYSHATDNIPPSSHEDSSLGDSLTLWSVDDSDDRWREVGSIALTDPNLRDGWNLRVVLDPDGTWRVGYAIGAIGQTPGLTALGVAVPNPADFAGAAYSGVGWVAPTTDNDYTDFGFDNFRVAAVPEPSSIMLALVSVVLLMARRRHVKTA